MTAYYNENDPAAAAWLRELIAQKHIAEGTVDTRSIEDVHPNDLQDFTQCHFFAGIGGWACALRLAGWPDNRRVWTGSCPRQPFSAAGKRAGVADERHLWPAFQYLISQCCPPIIFGEQVASKDGRLWLAGVRADLEAVGYAVGAADLCAAGIGAPHIRQRLYWVADAACKRPARQSVLLRPKEGGRNEGDFPEVARGSDGGQWGANWIACADGKARRLEPGLSPLAHGVPARVVRLRGYGNAIVPQVAAEFIQASDEGLALSRGQPF